MFHLMLLYREIAIFRKNRLVGFFSSIVFIILLIIIYQLEKKNVKETFPSSFFLHPQLWHLSAQFQMVTYFSTEIVLVDLCLPWGRFTRAHSTTHSIAAQLASTLEMCLTPVPQPVRNHTTDFLILFSLLLLLS